MVLPVHMFISITYYYRELTMPRILFIGIILLEHDVSSFRNNDECFIHDSYSE